MVNSNTVISGLQSCILIILLVLIYYRNDISHKMNINIVLTYIFIFVLIFTLLFIVGRIKTSYINRQIARLQNERAMNKYIWKHNNPARAVFNEVKHHATQLYKK